MEWEDQTANIILHRIFGTARGNELKQISQEEALEQYELAQKQRYLERGIRKWKRRERLFKTAEDKEYYKKCKEKVKEWQLKNKEFTKNNNLKRDFTRENIEKVTRVQKDDIITTENLLEKLNIKIEDYVPFGKYDPYENNIQEDAAKLLDIDKLPNFVSKTEYDKYDGKEITRVVHSYHGKTAKEAYDNTLKGAIQYSENTNSSYGRGIYFGEKANVEELLSFYGKEDNKIINAKISKNSKILEFKNQLEYSIDKEERLKKVPEHLKNFYKQESSLLYMLDGIDGINLKWNNYYCIYNRKVLIISE